MVTGRYTTGRLAGPGRLLELTAAYWLRCFVLPLEPWFSEDFLVGFLDSFVLCYQRYWCVLTLDSGPNHSPASDGLPSVISLNGNLGK